MGNPSKKLVCGIGINDAGYPVRIFANIDGKKKALWRCPFYRAWGQMLKRCYNGKFQSQYPTYAGCTVAPEWLSFSMFREWMAAQPWQGNEIDKDILAHGNKVYGPDSCVFVSVEMNNFMTDCAAARGEWPIGVYLDKSRGKFLSQCHNPFSGNREHLGRFDCPAEAHEAWRARKHQHACTYADQQSDPRIADALRTRYAKEYDQ